MEICLSETARFSWLELGLGPGILIIDNCLASPEAVREYALNLRYSRPPVPDAYPGWKSLASLAGAEVLMRILVAQYIRNWDASKFEALDVKAARALSQHFSVLAFDPITANTVGYNGQSQHVDGVAWLATVLYLFGQRDVSDSSRGTAFWRHRQSGLQHWFFGDIVQIMRAEKLLGLSMVRGIQSISSSCNIQSLGQASQVVFGRASESIVPFTADESETWEKIAFVEARFNRMIVYPTFQIHSIVDTTAPAPKSLADARLTMNTFIDYPFTLEPKAASVYGLDSYLPVMGLHVT